MTTTSNGKVVSENQTPTSGLTALVQSRDNLVRQIAAQTNAINSLLTDDIREAVAAYKEAIANVQRRARDINDALARMMREATATLDGFAFGLDGDTARAALGCDEAEPEDKPLLGAATPNHVASIRIKMNAPARRFLDSLLAAAAEEPRREKTQPEAQDAKNGSESAAATAAEDVRTAPVSSTPSEPAAADVHAPATVVEAVPIVMPTAAGVRKVIADRMAGMAAEEAAATPGSTRRRRKK